MVKKRLLALLTAVCLVAGTLSGCSSSTSVTEDMIPTVTDLRGTPETAESVATVTGLVMNTSYMAELTRLDGDNTEMAGVAAKDIPVVMKATSMKKDLKIKFVNEKNDKVITGTEFEVTVTDANGKNKNYTDDDMDGIIYIKEIDAGSVKVAMKSAGSYSVAEAITTTVKDTLEYATVDVSDEIKKESEINVSTEDADYGTGGSAATTTTPSNTVDYVGSTTTEVKDEVTSGTQKIDAFGQLVYSKLKLDKYGTEMYAKILSEPAADHVDANNDGTCDRCGATVTVAHTHSYSEVIVTEPTCTTDGLLENRCSCGSVESTEVIPKLGHIDVEPVDGKCDRCGADMATTTGALSIRNRYLLVGAAVTKIVYDTTSAPVYDTTSSPVYETVETVVETKYTGWQTIDGKTYYFDADGNKVTGTQVIQGVQYVFDSNGVRTGNIGIDVSKYQGSINWTKVKNAGISFVMIRCGYRGYGSGALVEDPCFAANITGAKAAGIRVGVYFFSQAITEAEAIEEASMAVSLVNRYGGVNMPIAIDSEYANGGAGRADQLSASARTTITKAFCNTVANSGYSPMVYASKSWFGSRLNVSSLSSYKIWVAHYASTCGYTGRYEIWQYTSSGSVNGVSTRCDMNISYM